MLFWSQTCKILKTKYHLVMNTHLSQYSFKSVFEIDFIGKAVSEVALAGIVQQQGNCQKKGRRKKYSLSKRYSEISGRKCGSNGQLVLNEGGRGLCLDERDDESFVLIFF